MNIVLHPDIKLSIPCKKVSGVDIELLSGMWKTMKEHGGIGLAAPQVGVNARVFVTGWAEVFVNPEILRSELPVWSTEGCLSLPGQLWKVKRFNKITMADGAEYEGTKAVVIQHELQHLDGILICDIGERVA